MSKRKRRKRADDNSLAGWQEWTKHQYDLGYWVGTGRLRPSVPLAGGIMLVVVVGCLVVATIVSAVQGNTAAVHQLPITLVVGGLALAGGVLITRKSQKRSRQRTQREHRRRQR